MHPYARDQQAAGPRRGAGPVSLRLRPCKPDPHQPDDAVRAVTAPAGSLGHDGRAPATERPLSPRPAGARSQRPVTSGLGPAGSSSTADHTEPRHVVAPTVTPLPLATTANHATRRRLRRRGPAGATAALAAVLAPLLVLAVVTVVTPSGVRGEVLLGAWIVLAVLVERLDRRRRHDRDRAPPQPPRTWAPR
jgi:hypothetical protein